VSVNKGGALFCTPSLSASCLLGSDASGANVFFSTTDELVGTDTDNELDYYDARTCTAGDPCIASPAAPLPPCREEACHGTPPATPAVPNAPSATFNGQGNLTRARPGHPAAKPLTHAQKLARALAACRKKHNKHKRKLCQTRARRAYGAIKKAHARKGDSSPGAHR
jgi:hypothetical protein